MSVILLVALISYVVIAMMFNIGFLYVYREDKEGWTDSDLVNKTSMFVCSIGWPVALVYGLCKMSKLDDEEDK